MPFVRITLNQELNKTQADIISEVIHQSLIAHFNIPEDDYFHVIEAVHADQIRYPQHYLGITHTSMILFIQIIAARGRTKEQKAALYAGIAAGIAQKTAVKKSDVIIVLQEVEGIENWSFGNGEIQVPEHLKQLQL